MTLSTSVVNLDNDILVTCVGLKECKKTNVNGVQKNILVIIHSENVANWEQLKNISSWVNIDLVDCIEVQEASNISLSFINESIHNISKFNIYLKNSKRKHIKFKENDEKIPQFNFIIEVIYALIMMKGDFNKEDIKKLLNKTLKDIQKFEKFSQKDQKKFQDLQPEKKKKGCNIKSYRF